MIIFSRKITKTYKIKCLRENMWKPPKIEVVGIFPPILKNIKNRNKRKGKGGLLVFFDDELTTFRNKNNRFICNV